MGYIGSDTKNVRQKHEFLTQDDFGNIAGIDQQIAKDKRAFQYVGCVCASLMASLSSGGKANGRQQIVNI